MQLWSFIWTQSSDRLVSARIAAETKAAACALLHDIADPYADGVICQFAGAIDTAEGICSFTAREAA